MTPERIEVAIDALCQELSVHRTVRPVWQDLSEDRVFREVAASILGSRVSFEMALAATDRLAEEGLLQFRGDQSDYLLRVEEALCQPLSYPAWERCRRYGFPRTRSRALASTAAAFYADGGTIKGWLARSPDSRSARRGMVEKAAGIGPKQASMVLRNIGFCDRLAILDSHLMRFMRLRGIGDPGPLRVSTLEGYEKAEHSFLNYARRSGWPPAVLDQAVWLVMRVSARRSV
jgi:N-glycosylase/DNA lyase